MSLLNDINVKYWELCHSRAQLGIKKDDSYQCRCDVCGDSKTKLNEKRLYLYRKTGYDGDSVHCFNCDYTGTMYSYLRDYHPEFFNSYNREIKNNKINNLKASLLVIKQLEVIKSGLVFFKQDYNIIPIEQSPLALEYILKRNLSPFGIYFTSSNIIIDNKTLPVENSIIIPLLKQDSWYGFYSRKIDRKMFYTYLPEQNTGYKIWNYFRVTKYDTLYVFEAIFDAMSSGLSNVIAMLGADIDDKMLKDFTDVVYVYDNDDTGRKKTLEKLKEGKKCFIWDKIAVKDINELRKELSLVEIRDYIIKNTYTGILGITKLKLRT